MKPDHRAEQKRDRKTHLKTASPDSEGPSPAVGGLGPRGLTWKASMGLWEESERVSPSELRSERSWGTKTHTLTPLRLL